MSERFSRFRRAATPTVVTAIVLAVLPLLAPDAYNLSVFTSFCINLLLLTGLNLISGYGGQMSLGQACFYGVGAYTITIGSAKLGLSPVLCFFLAPIVAAVFAVAVGIPSLRLRGLFFAMATLGVGVIYGLFLERAESLTGGPNGVRVPVVHIGHVNFTQPRTIYITAAVTAVIGVVASQLFLRTRVGWGLRAARASEPAAAVVGVNIFGVRLVALALSGAFAGIGGALQDFNTLYLSPTSFGFFTSVMAFIVLTIGGMGTWGGPLFGAALLLVFDRWLTAYVDKEPLILAAVFVISLRLFPRGAARALTRVAAHVHARRAESGPARGGRA